MATLRLVLKVKISTLSHIHDTFAGASSGIGATTAVEFAKNGAKLILTGRNEERLQQTSKMCQNVGLNKDSASSLSLIVIVTMCTYVYVVLMNLNPLEEKTFFIFVIRSSSFSEYWYTSYEVTMTKKCNSSQRRNSPDGRLSILKTTMSFQQ